MRLTNHAAIRDRSSAAGDASRIVPPSDVVSHGSGFFDPDHPTQGLRDIILDRGADRGKEQFLLKSPIGYLDRTFGVFVVPRPGEALQTDLASVPQIFTWLVPKSGTHLPAALLHDGLIPPSDGTYLGPPITRPQADRIFRDGMRDLGTGGIRRWLVWTAVTFATALDEATNDGAWRTPRGLWLLARIVGFIFLIVLLGSAATLDVVGAAALVPWMGHHSVAYELFTGGLFAVLVPAAMSLLFLGRGMVRAALILGIAMALLLHVTAVLWLLLLLYNLAESALDAVRGRGPWRTVALWLAALGTTLLGGLVLVRAELAVSGDWVFHPFRVPGATAIGEAVGNAGTWLWDRPAWLSVVALVLATVALGRLILLERQANGDDADIVAVPVGASDA